MLQVNGSQATNTDISLHIFKPYHCRPSSSSRARMRKKVCRIWCRTWHAVMPIPPKPPITKGCCSMMPLHLLWTNSLHCEHSVEFLPTPLQQTVQGYLPDFFRPWWPASDTRNLVLFMLTMSLLLSFPAFYAFSWNTRLLGVCDEHQVVSVKKRKLSQHQD